MAQTARYPVLIMVGVAMASLSFLRSPAFAQVAPQTKTFESVADAYVDSLAPTATHGTQYFFRVGYNTEDIYRSLVRFDLADIPRGAVVQSAELRLYLYQQGTGADNERIQARTILAGWDEAKVTWSNQPGSIAPSASQTVGKTQGWFSWDVKNTVQGWADRRYGNNGFLLRAEDEGANAVRTFASREAPPPIQPPTFRAKLVVTWMAVTATPTRTRTPATTPTPSASPSPAATATPSLSPTASPSATPSASSTVTPTPVPGYRDVGVVRIWADQFVADGIYTVARGHVRLGSAGQTPLATGLVERLRRWWDSAFAREQPAAEAASHYTAGDETRWPTAGGTIDVRGRLAFEANSNPLLESTGAGTLSVIPTSGAITYTTATPLITRLGNSYLSITTTVQATVLRPMAVLRAKVPLDLPENIGLVANIAYEIDAMDRFTATSRIDLNVKVAGGTLDVRELQPALDGLKADSARYQLPDVGNLNVTFRKIVIDAASDGKPRLTFEGAADFDLPDVDLGNGVFLLKKLKGSLSVSVPTSGQTKYKIALKGELELNLPKNRGQRVAFKDLSIQDGVVKGKTETTLEINLFGQKDLALGPFEFSQEVYATAGEVSAGHALLPRGPRPADEAGLSADSPLAFRYKLLPEWTRWDLSGQLGLPKNSSVIEIKDVSLTTESPFIDIRGDAAGTFTLAGPVGLGGTPPVVALKTIKGKLAYNPNSSDWSIAATTDVVFNLEAVSVVPNLTLTVDQRGIRGKMPSMAIGVTGLVLSLTDVDFDKGAFSAATGSLKLPAAWGGDAFVIKDATIDKDGLRLGQAGGVVNLPDRKLGDVLALTKLKAGVMLRLGQSGAVTGTARTLYSVALSGTLTVALADQSTAGASFGGSFKDGKFRGQVDGLSFMLSGFGFGVEHGDFEGEEVKAETVQLTLPAKLVGAGGTAGVTLHQLVIGGPKGFSFAGGEVAIPDFKFYNIGFQTVRLKFERQSNGRYAVAGSAKINLQTFAVKAAFNVIYQAPSDVSVERVAMAFSGSVAQGTAIAVYPPWLYLTEIRGEFDLRNDTVKISYGATFAGPLEVAGLPVFSADVDTTLTLKPCCRYLHVGTSKFIILEVDRTELEMSNNPPFMRFSREAHLPDYLTKVKVTMVVGLDQDKEFTLWGTLEAKVGIDKGDLGHYAGAPLPPHDVTLADAELAVGRFQKDGDGTRWGARVKFKVAGVKLYAFYNFKSGHLSGGLNKNNPYHGVKVETQSALRQRPDGPGDSGAPDQAAVSRFRYTIGPSSQIVVAETITTTSVARSFGLMLTPPGGGAPFKPPVAYSDDHVTLYAYDDPAAGEWLVSVPAGNEVTLTGIEPDPVVRELEVTEGQPMAIRWSVTSPVTEATVRLTAIGEDGATYPLAQDLPPVGTMAWTPRLANGRYRVQVDAGAVDEEPVSRRSDPFVINDVQPPAAPAGMAVLVNADGTVEARWDAAPAEPDIAGYRVTLDGYEYPPLELQSDRASLGALAPGTRHALSVRAFDIAGNVGPAATQSFTVPALVIEALSPAAGAEGAVTSEVSVSFNLPVSQIRLTVSDAAGMEPPGHLVPLAVARSDGTTVTYGARYVADDPWPTSTYRAAVHAQAESGDTVDFSWLWGGGRQSLYLPAGRR